MVDQTTTIFGVIRDESEGMASIAEEHSAATEEMLSVMEEQNTNIAGIYDYMKEIKTSGDNLRGVLNNRQ
ncbi:MAG: methyl-accepting chemotaxis sensory transducer [Herbinix sp.]|nr:methyl-accepting chemotaxis sensory transducer [Herbinix sp.]